MKPQVRFRVFLSKVVCPEAIDILVKEKLSVFTFIMLAVYLLHNMKCILPTVLPIPSAVTVCY